MKHTLNPSASGHRSVQSGFTLIELIIVIVVIGVLAAVALPRFGTVTTQADTAKKKAVLAGVKTAWAVAYAKESPPAPPTALKIADEMDPKCTAVDGTTDQFSCGNVKIKFNLPSGSTVVNSTSDITLVQP